MARKANGQGHTYKVKNSYRTVIRSGDQNITAMAATAQESRKIAKEKLEKLPRFVGEGKTSPLSKQELGKYLMTWLENVHQHQIAHSTFKRYRGLAIHHIIPVIGNISLRNIQPSNISLVLQIMRESGQSPRSQQQARALLSIAFGEAEDFGYIPSNPVKKVRVPVNKSKEISPLTIDEVKRLLDTYEGTPRSARLHIALICGLRQGESLGLRWQDIDFEGGNLLVRHQIQMMHGSLQLTGLKTERSKRSLVLTEVTLEALQGHKNHVLRMMEASGTTWQENDLLFPSADGTPLHATLDYNEWKRALRLCGIAPRRLHDARHTAATLMYSQGVGIEVISRALGHSSSAITSKLYVHSAREPQRNAAELLNKLLN